MTAEEKVALIVGVADDMKAEAIETLDIKDKTSIADYFVLCTGTNDRQISAIARPQGAGASNGRRWQRLGAPGLRRRRAAHYAGRATSIL